MTAWSAAAIAQQEQFLARLSAVGARIAPEYRYTTRRERLLGASRSDVCLRCSSATARSPASTRSGSRIRRRRAERRRRTCRLPSPISRSQASTAPASRSRCSTRASIRPIPTCVGACSRVSTSSIREAAASRSRIRRFPVVPSATRPSSPGSSPAPRARRPARRRAGSVDPADPRRRLAAERRGRLQRLLAHRPDPRRARGGGRPERRRRHARRRPHRARSAMVEPYASFADGPLPRAIAGAADLDMLVDRPRRERRSCGTWLREHRRARRRASSGDRGCGGRRVSALPTVRVHVRAGLRVLFEDDVPLGGAPTETVTADVVLVDRRTAARGHRRTLLRDRA